MIDDRYYTFKKLKQILNFFNILFPQKKLMNFKMQIILSIYANIYTKHKILKITNSKQTNNINF